MAKISRSYKADNCRRIGHTMPIAPFIWVIVFILRVIFNDNPNSIAGKAGMWFSRRGKVAGDRGPDMRSFRGRAGRREWWITMAWSALVGGLIGLVPVIGALLALPWTIASLAVSARRLHDLNLSAWVQTAPMAVAATSLAFYGAAHFGFHISFTQTIVDAGLSLIGIVYGAFYIFIGFAPGKAQSNWYGEADPAT